MKRLDIILSGITIFLVLIMLFLVQAVINPEIFKYLNVFSFFSNNSSGLKNAIIVIFTLGFISSCLLLLLFGRIIIRLLTQK